jgi:hypothetical protein
MRATSVTLAFLFLSTVLATPIYPTHGDTAASFAKRGPGGTSTSTGHTKGTVSKAGKGSTSRAAASKQICKRTTATALITALRSVDGPPIGKGQLGTTFRLTKQYEGKAAVVKVIKTKDIGAEFIKQEIFNLKAVHQFLAWGRRLASEGSEGLDYILMPDMGLMYDKVGGLTKAKAEELVQVAHTRYKTVNKMAHDDVHLGNAVFKKIGDNQYECHLVDWFFANNVEGPNTYTDPGEPLPIALTDCVFDPFVSMSGSEHSSGSAGYQADKSSSPSQGSPAHGSPAHGSPGGSPGSSSPMRSSP